MAVRHGCKKYKKERRILLEVTEMGNRMRTQMTDDIGYYRDIPRLMQCMATKKFKSM